MKKILLALFIPLIFILASCEDDKTYVPESRTVIATVKPDKWAPVYLKGTDRLKRFETGIDMPELDSRTLEIYGLMVYVSFDGRSWEQIPKTSIGLSYHYQASTGTIILTVEAADNTDLDPSERPGEMDVKVVISPSREIGY